MLSFFTDLKPRIAQTIETYLRLENVRLKTVNSRAAKRVMECAELAVGGKMVRGSLVCLGYTLTGKPIDATALKLAAAIELAHTALLVHDDIMDGDTLRRGDLALHTRYAAEGTKEKLRQPARFGEATATCLADMAFFWAFNLATQALATQPERLGKALELLTNELAMVGAAQLQDVWSGNHDEPETLPSIFATYRYKTARYTFSLPLMLGVLAGGGEQTTADALSRFGEHIGIVFQISDDTIGLFGNQEKIGKPIGSDIREGKKTLYHHFLFRLTGGAEQKRLCRIFGTADLKSSDLDFVRELIERYGISEKINRIAQKELVAARQALEQAGLTQQHQMFITEIIDYIEHRSA